MFFKRKEEVLLTASKAKELTMSVLDLREQGNNKRILSAIRSRADGGYFTIDFNSPQSLYHSNDGYFSGLYVLPLNQRKYIESLGYNVETKTRMVQFRESKTDGTWDFKIETYEYYTISWK